MASDKEKQSLFASDLTWFQKLIYFCQLVLQRIKSGNIGLSSKAVVYYGLLSFFPLISLVGSALPLFHLDPQMLLGYAQNLMPTRLIKFIDPILTKLLTQKSNGLLSFGILGTLWSSSGVVNILKRSVNQVYGLDNQTIYTKKSFLNFLILRSVAILVTTSLILVLLILLLTVLVGQQLLNWLQSYVLWGPKLLQEFIHWKWPVTGLVLVVILLVAYIFLPNSHEKISYVWPGTLFTTLGFSLLSQGFSLYIKYFGSRWHSYGTIGTFFILVLWLNFLAYIFLIGAAINAAVLQAFQGQLEQSGGLKQFYQQRKNHHK